jgi:hypothetical protein
MAGTGLWRDPVPAVVDQERARGLLAGDAIEHERPRRARGGEQRQPREMHGRQHDAGAPREQRIERERPCDRNHADRALHPERERGRDVHREQPSRVDSRVAGLRDVARVPPERSRVGVVSAHHE